MMSKIEEEEEEELSSGLKVNEQEFMALPQKKQLCVLFQNEVAIFKAVAEYRKDTKKEMLKLTLKQKIQAILIGLLMSGVGFLIYIHLIK